METLGFGTVIVMGGEDGGDFTPIFSAVCFDGGAECFILCRFVGVMRVGWCEERGWNDC